MCWPWADVYLEEEPKKKKKKPKSVNYYDPVSKMWVKLEGVSHVVSTAAVFYFLCRCALVSFLELEMFAFPSWL